MAKNVDFEVQTGFISESDIKIRIYLRGGISSECPNLYISRNKLAFFVNLA